VKGVNGRGKRTNYGSFSNHHVILQEVLPELYRVFLQTKSVFSMSFPARAGYRVDAMALAIPTCTSVPKVVNRVRDWGEVAAHEHFVQFYRTDDYLIECLAGFIADGMRKGESGIVIATPEHRHALECRLKEKGLIHEAWSPTEHYIVCDAGEMLSRFMRDGRPDRELFFATVGRLVQDMNLHGRPVRAFGEMVAMLWIEGNKAAAIEVEQLWNELGETEAFTLFCAYPVSCTKKNGDELDLEHICRAHSSVVSIAA
jgi:hypothetical protein